jgi:hypothetical protein
MLAPRHVAGNWDVTNFGDSFPVSRGIAGGFVSAGNLAAGSACSFDLFGGSFLSVSELEGQMKLVVSAWRVCGVFAVGTVLVAQVGAAQTAKPKPKSSSKNAAVWSPDVQQALGVSASDFTGLGLNKLTKTQLAMLELRLRPDPNKHLLTCPASGTVPGGRIRVLLTVAGDDSTGAIAGQIRQAVGSLSGVDVVDSAASADRVLNVVIQEQTTAKRTIGFTASYLTGTPCTEEIAGKKTDVELKGTLGSYTDAKGLGLAQDLAGMLDQDLQSLRPHAPTPAPAP